MKNFALTSVTAFSGDGSLDSNYNYSYNKNTQSGGSAGSADSAASDGQRTGILLFFRHSTNHSLNFYQIAIITMAIHRDMIELYIKPRD